MAKHRRRLQRIGSSTLVSLPKEWVEANSLSKGDEVGIDAERGALVLSAGAGARPARELEIPYPLPRQENVVASITGAYLLGYDIVRIAGGEIPPEDHENVRRAMRSLVGMEIVEESGQSVSMQFLPDATALSPQMVLRRMNAIVVGMHGEAAAAVGARDRSGLRALAARDAEVNRQYFLLVRLTRSAMADRRLAGAFSLANIDVLDYRIAAHLVEGAGDAVVELAGALAETAVPRADVRRVRALAETSSRVGTLAVEALVARSRKTAIEAIAAHREFQAGIASLRSSLEGRAGVRLGYLDMLYMLERVERSWADVADLITPDYEGRVAQE